MKHIVGSIVVVVLLTVLGLTLLERKQQIALETNCRSEGGYFVHYFKDKTVSHHEVISELNKLRNK